MILTSSFDSFLRIWDLHGNLICNMNIKHPLPIKWGIKNDLVESKKEIILYGIKLLESIIDRYWKVMSLDEEKNLRIYPFLEHIVISINNINNQKSSNE